MSGNAI